MTDQIPAHVRPVAFGLAGLMGEMIAFLRSLFGDDLESALIMVCVTNAAMRKFMVDAGPGAEIYRRPILPDEMRGSISRRMIADKTGLPRETVRRKVATLIERGLLYVDDTGGIRPTPRLHEQAVQVAISSAHEAVVRYTDVVSSYGVNG